MASQVDVLLGLKLRGWRMDAKLNQLQLAQKIGISNYQSVGELEKGKTIFSDELIIKICEAFDKSVLEFTSLNNGGQINYSPN